MITIILIKAKYFQSGDRKLNQSIDEKMKLENVE